MVAPVQLVCQVMQQRINDVTDRVFRPLSSRLGVPNIRQYEEAHASFRQGTDAKKVELAKQVWNPLAQRSYLFDLCMETLFAHRCGKIVLLLTGDSSCIHRPELRT